MSYSPARRQRNISRNAQVAAAITARVPVSFVGIQEGPIFMEMTEEEGPQETYRISIVGEIGGREYVLRGVSFRPQQRYTAQQLADKIADRGTVDLSLWEALPPRLSLEERFAAYAHNEMEVRMGFRSEEDLYHGV